MSIEYNFEKLSLEETSILGIFFLLQKSLFPYTDYFICIVNYTKILCLLLLLIVWVFGKLRIHEQLFDLCINELIKKAASREANFRQVALALWALGRL
jgi:hypothetical protein